MARSAATERAVASAPEAPAGSWHVYIVMTDAGTLYTGITTDPRRRLGEHRRGSRGARFFNTSAAMRMVYCERCDSRSQALQREAAIKRMPRAAKLQLIAATPVPVPA